MSAYDSNTEGCLGMAILFVALLILTAILFYSSKGDVTYEKHRADTGECVEFVQKSNGWNKNLVAIRDC